MSKDPFVGGRLTLARDLRSMSQVRLGEEVASSQAVVSKVEKDLRPPPSDLVQAFGEVLGFETRFFHLPIRSVQSLNFRSRARTPARVRKRIVARGVLLGELISTLREHVDLPPYTVPHESESDLGKLERVAEKCRLKWDLGLDGPIDDATRVIERAGVPVYLIHDESDDVDGLSIRGAEPLIVLNAAKRSTSRSRFDAIHELAHLIFGHPDGSADVSPGAEEAAHRFASAFLLPGGAFGADFLQLFSPRDFSGLLELKRHWKVSAAAMIRRARDLRLISATTYRRAYKKLSFLGWRKEEPDEPERERPSMIRNAIEVATSSDTSVFELANQLGWAPSTFQELTGVHFPAIQHDANVIPLHPS